jgi:hypothetical protein
MEAIDSRLDPQFIYLYLYILILYYVYMLIKF